MAGDAIGVSWTWLSLSLGRQDDFTLYPRQTNDHRREQSNPIGGNRVNKGKPARNDGVKNQDSVGPFEDAAEDQVRRLTPLLGVNKGTEGPGQNRNR